jgi:hypothetical protein
MTVGMRPTESGTATPTHPDPDEQLPGVAATEPAETRRALRVARRQRRHLATLCAVVVAVCLVLTLLIVSLARDRAPGTVSGPPLAVAVAPAGR